MDKEHYISELKSFFGSDERRIHHALKVLAFAEQIMAGEKVDAATRRIVIITAILHDVGIKIAEAKHQSSAGVFQEMEGPGVAKPIMQSWGEAQTVIDRVCYIIGGHHTPTKNDGLDFQIIWEADLLVNIEEEDLANRIQDLTGVIEKNFRTLTGKKIARQKYLSSK